MPLFTNLALLTLLPSRAEAFAFDESSGTTKWQDTIILELDQLDEYETFIDKGKQAHAPNGFKRINVHFVFDCKQDLRHKAPLGGRPHDSTTKRQHLFGCCIIASMQIIVLLVERGIILPHQTYAQYLSHLHGDFTVGKV
jgi:hypothetical protein